MSTYRHISVRLGKSEPTRWQSDDPAVLPCHSEGATDFYINDSYQYWAPEIQCRGRAVKSVHLHTDSSEAPIESDVNEYEHLEILANVIETYYGSGILENGIRLYGRANRLYLVKSDAKKRLFNWFVALVFCVKAKDQPQGPPLVAPLRSKEFWSQRLETMLWSYPFPRTHAPAGDALQKAEARYKKEKNEPHAAGEYRTTLRAIELRQEISKRKRAGLVESLKNSVGLEESKPTPEALRRLHLILTGKVF